MSYAQPPWGPRCDPRALKIDPDTRANMQPAEWIDLLGRPPSAYEWKPPTTDQIPNDWQRDIPYEFIKMGLEDGELYLGWAYEDYIIYSASFAKYESPLIWAVQSSGKSDKMLYDLFLIYRDWDVVLQNIVYSPNQLLDRFKKTPKGTRMPATGYDDITVHYPSGKFKTDPELYEAVDSMWAAIRTKASVVIGTAPVVSRVPKNIKDNVTIEVKMGRNGNMRYNRIFKMPGKGTIDENMFKVQIEQPYIFDLYQVPLKVYRAYEEERLELAEQAIKNLEAVADVSEIPDGFCTLLEASEILGKGVNTVQQMHSRGAIEGVKVKKRIYISRSEAERIAAVEAKHPRHQKPVL